MSDPFLDALTRRAGGAAPPPTSMQAITMRSESGGHDLSASGGVLTSSAGAKGRMQVMDSTNLNPGFGVRPAADGSLDERARVGSDYLNAMMQRYGDPAKAWAAYNAGPGAVDKALARGGDNWLGLMPGETRSYVAHNVGQLQGAPAAPAAPSLPAPDASQDDPNDPFLSALKSVITPPRDSSNSPVPQAAPGQMPQGAGNPGGNRLPAGPNIGVPGTVAGLQGSPVLHPVLGGPQTGVGGPVQWTQSLADTGNGFLQSGLNTARNVAHYGMQALNPGGMVDGSNASVDSQVNSVIDPSISGLKAHAYSPDGLSQWAGKFGGDVAATIPLGELKVAGMAADSAPWLARLARGVANYGAQGGAMGAMTGGKGNDLGSIAMGVGAGALLGPVGEMALGPLWNGASKLVAPGAAVEAAANKVMPPEVKQGIMQMINNGETAENIKAAYPEWAGVGNNKSALDQLVKMHAQSGYQTGEQNFSQPTKEQLAAAVAKASPQGPPAPQDIIGSRANNTGIESNPGITPGMAPRVVQLQQQGLPVDQAVRQARLEALGVPHTLGMVNRDPVALRGEVEGAKLDTPEGKALAAQRASGNGIISDQMADLPRTFAPDGVVPGPGEATKAAAVQLRNAADAAQRGVNAKYKAARAADPDALIPPNNLVDLLNSPDARNVVDGTPEGALLQQTRNAIDSGQAAHDSKIMPLGMSPDNINNIAVAANRKWTTGPSPDGTLNHWVGAIADATSKDLDTLDGMGPKWADARAAHRDMQQQFYDPKGVRDLIASTGKAGDPTRPFVNDNNWRNLDSMWTGNRDTAGHQVITALNNNGGDDALGLIRSHVAQQAYQAATGAAGSRAGNAIDQLNNSPVNGALYHGALNKVGNDKLAALFSPDEISQMANLGHAANTINELPKGVDNSSNSASAILNSPLLQALKQNAAAQKPGMVAKGIATGIPGAALMLGGHMDGAMGVLLGGMTKTPAKALADALTARAAAKAANQAGAQISNVMSPSLARTAMNDNAFTNAMRAAAKAKAARAGSTTVSTANAAQKQR